MNLADRVQAIPPTIEQWRVITLEDGSQAFVGIVRDHPHLREDARVVTSSLQWVDERAGLARICNRLHLLGVRAGGPLPNEWAARVDALLACDGRAKRLD